MNMAFIKRHEISYEKRLEIVFYKTNGNKLLGKLSRNCNNYGLLKECSFRCMQKFFKFRTVKNLPRVGRPKKIKIPRHEKSLLGVPRSSRFEPLQNIVLACKKRLTFETLAKNTARQIIKKYSL